MYPIISNQRSMSFTWFITQLAAEVSNLSLWHPHLEFLSFFKYVGHRYQDMSSYLNTKKRVAVRVTRPDYFKMNKLYKSLANKYGKLFVKRYGKSYKQLFRKYKYIIPEDKIFIKNIVKLHNKQKVPFQECFTPIFKARPRPLVPNKPMFIINKRNFTFRIRDIIQRTTDTFYIANKRYYDYLRKFLYHAFFLKLKKLLSIIIRHNKKHPKNKSHKNNKRSFRDKLLLKKLINICQQIIIINIGLRNALKRKKKTRL